MTMLVGRSIARMLLCLAILLMAVETARAQAQLVCRRGYTHSSLNGQEFCFQVSNDKKTFQEASSYCYANGGHLAEPRTYLLDLALTAFLQKTANSKNNDHWIGMSNFHNPVDFMWAWKETSTGQESYSQWKSGQNIFDGVAPRCVFKTGGTKLEWVSSSCQAQKYYVCEQDVTCQSRLGWVSRSINSQCSRLMEATNTFPQASNACRRFNGTLAVASDIRKDLPFWTSLFKSQASQTPTTVSNGAFWIGLVGHGYQDFRWEQPNGQKLGLGLFKRNGYWSTMLLKGLGKKPFTPTPAAVNASETNQQLMLHWQNSLLPFLCQLKERMVAQFKCSWYRDAHSHSLASPCLVFVSGYRNVTDARLSCEKIGGTLPVLRNEMDAIFLSWFVLRKTKLQGSTTWLGLNDVANEGVYKWENNHPYTPIPITTKSALWQNHEPSDTSHTENYVLLNNRNEKIIDHVGSYLSATVCQVRDQPFREERCNWGHNAVSHSVGGPCLIFVDKAKNVTEAKSLCKKMHGTLPVLTKGVDLAFLSSYVIQHSQRFTTWLALNDVDNEGVYQWEHDGYYTPIPVQSASPLWQTGEPNDPSHTQNYVMLNNRNSKLIDSAGSQHSAVVCQVKECNPGWTKIEYPYFTYWNNRYSCITTFPQKKTFFGALQDCGKIGAVLMPLDLGRFNDAKHKFGVDNFWVFEATTWLQWAYFLGRNAITRKVNSGNSTVEKLITEHHNVVCMAKPPGAFCRSQSMQHLRTLCVQRFSSYDLTVKMSEVVARTKGKKPRKTG